MTKWNKVTLINLALVLATIGTLCGCAKTAKEAEAVSVEDKSVETAVEDNTAEAEEEVTGLVNPMEEVDYDKICEVTGCDAFLPDNAENLQFFLVDGKLGEVRYTTENGSTQMTLRAQKADEFTDISGLYYDWTFLEDGNIWDYTSKEMGIRDAEGDIHVVNWYNQYSGVMYSLAAQASDLDGFDITAVAMNLMMPEESDFDCYSNGIEERAGKTSFDSYDEIISLLEGTEAYGYADVYGYDEPVLFIAEESYGDGEGGQLAIEVTPYTKKSNGKITSDGVLASGGTANPISVDDNGIIYCATHSSIEKDCYGDNGTDDNAMMLLAYVYIDEYDDNGQPKTVGGFLRTNNSLVDDDLRDVDPSDVDTFEKLFEDLTKAHPIAFTVAE